MINGRGYWFRVGMVIAAAAALYLTGSGRVSLWDRDEPWYAQTSRQMLQSGDWMMTHFLDKPRYAKPIFIYWCQATSMRFFGDNAFAARFPSAVGMTTTLLILAIVLRRAIGAQRALLTVFIFATSAVVIGSAKVSLIDAVLMVFLTGAQLCLFAVYRASVLSWHGRLGRELAETAALNHGRDGRATSIHPKRTSWPVILTMWICIGFAGLTKGPIVLAVLLATMVALAVLDIGGQWRSPSAWLHAFRWWPHTRPLIGLAVVAVIVLPWILTLYFRDAASRQFLFNMLHEPGQHLKGDKEGHAGPPGWHLATVWVMYFPWSLLLPTAIAMGFRHRKLPQIRFALASVLGVWVFVELMATKLPHYLLPAYSSMAFLTADALVRCVRGQHPDLRRRGFLIGAVGWAVGAILLACFPWAPTIFYPIAGLYSIPAAITFTALGTVYALVIVWLWTRHRMLAAVHVMGWGMIGLIVIIYGWYLPNARFLRLPEETGMRLRELGAGPSLEKGQIFMDGYSEPSLAFYQGGTIREQRNVLTRRPPEDWPQWLVTTTADFDPLPREQRALWQELGRFRGLNYAGGGKFQTLLILKKNDAPVAITSGSQ